MFTWVLSEVFGILVYACAWNQHIADPGLLEGLSGIHGFLEPENPLKTAVRPHDSALEVLRSVTGKPSLSHGHRLQSQGWLQALTC